MYIYVLKGFFFALGISKLLKAADKFLEKFSLRRLKFGTIMEFLEKFNMQSSKEAMARVFKEIKVCLFKTFFNLTYFIFEWFC